MTCSDPMHLMELSVHPRLYPHAFEVLCKKPNIAWIWHNLSDFGINLMTFSGFDHWMLFVVTPKISPRDQANINDGSKCPLPMSHYTLYGVKFETCSNVFTNYSITFLSVQWFRKCVVLPLIGSSRVSKGSGVHRREKKHARSI